MSDKPLTITLPEELIDQALAAQLDLRGIVEHAILMALHHPVEANVTVVSATVGRNLPPDQPLTTGQAIPSNQRIPSLHAAHLTLSAEALAPLPDETWGDLFQ